MIAAFSRALGDSIAAEQRRFLLLSLGLALALLVGLWIAASALIAGLHVSGFPWLNSVINVLGLAICLKILRSW